jgi:hypothetical protein
LPLSDPDEREWYYREHVENSPTLRTLKAAMDEWCAIWFWPTDEESLTCVPTPLTFHKPHEFKDALVARISDEMRFFHWELEFPDVFTPSRSGFDGMIGNPPWDVMKPNSQEFFTEFDPLYRTYDKQAAIKKQKELRVAMPHVADSWDEYNARFKALGNWARNVAEPFDLALSRGTEGESLAKLWSKQRDKHHGFADARHPFRLQGSADLNSYKMFTECFWNLLRHDGRLGVILPTGIYSDLGSKTLREVILLQGNLVFLYGFQNEKRVFAAALHNFKQVILILARGGQVTTFHTRFRMGVGDSPEAHEIPDDLLRNQSAMPFTSDDIRYFNPTSLGFVELGTPKDLAVFRKIYDHSFRLGENTANWEITFATEFHMSNDSKHFPPLGKWEEAG